MVNVPKLKMAESKLKPLYFFKELQLYVQLTPTRNPIQTENTPIYGMIPS